MSLVTLLLNVLLIGVVFYVIWWGIRRVGLPDPFDKVAVVVYVILVVYVLLAYLLPLASSI